MAAELATQTRAAEVDEVEARPEMQEVLAAPAQVLEENPIVVEETMAEAMAETMEDHEQVIQFCVCSLLREASD